MSNNLENSYNWIVSCINSSSNKFQFDCCRTLIELFETMYKDSTNWNNQLKTDLETFLDNLIVKHSIDI